MMHHNQRSVNVKRSDLLSALKTNLDAHRIQYAEAVTDYRAKLQRDLKTKLKEVNAVSDDTLVKINGIHFSPPQNHESEYIEMIEMFEMSVDDTINLDHQSFKAYFKNEWPWAAVFAATAMSYKG
jgi:hypothetical protein